MNIYKKLFEAKKEIGKISKDSTNPFFKSKYFDINALLEHVEPILQKHGLLVLQPIKNGLVTTQIIDSETGELVESEIALTNITDPQKRGSEITYYRRYTLQSLLGLQADDDDGNKASQQTKKSTSTQVQTQVYFLSQWQDAISAIDSEEGMKKFYNSNKTAIESDPKIKELTVVKTNQLRNQKN